MRTKWMLGLLSFSLSLFAAIPADADGVALLSSPCYLKIKGQVSGDFSGGVTQKGHENAIVAQSVHFDIEVPADPATGMPTGKRIHKPLTIVKEVDSASPQLLQSLVTNENLTLFDLQLTAPGNPDVVEYRIGLNNAHVAFVHMITVDGRAREEVGFTYQKITWTWVHSGKTATDDWSR